MEEQVLDIASVLKTINGKVDSLTKQLDIASAKLETALTEIVVLKSRLAVYETPKDSHNSSIPPFKESLKAQGINAKKLLMTRSLRRKSGKSTDG